MDRALPGDVGGELRRSGRCARRSQEANAQGETEMSKLKVTTDVPTEIHMTREFDAPRKLVMRAMSEPALMMRWQGNSCSPIISVDVDFRVGGVYRHVYRTPDGKEFSF